MCAREVGELVSSIDQVVGALDSREQVTWDAVQTDDRAGKLASDRSDCVGVAAAGDRVASTSGRLLEAMNCAKYSASGTVSTT